MPAMLSLARIALDHADSFSQGKRLRVHGYIRKTVELQAHPFPITAFVVELAVSMI
jgi:hypothetical protein